MLMLLNVFDETIIHLLNSNAHESLPFDEAVVFLSESLLLKGGVLMVVVWYLWFVQKQPAEKNRQHIIATILGSFVAMFIARILPKMLPFRSRPILNPNSHIIQAYSLNKESFDTLSSFPSDHATLFFALSIGLLYCSKRAGIFSLLYTILFIACPRIYLGLHYPTDLLGGAAIGVFVVTIANSRYFLVAVSGRILSFTKGKDHLFYPLFFLITYQIADLFNGSRSLLTMLGHLLH